MKDNFRQLIEVLDTLGKDRVSEAKDPNDYSTKYSDILLDGNKVEVQIFGLDYPSSLNSYVQPVDVMELFFQSSKDSKMINGQYYGTPKSVSDKLSKVMEAFPNNLKWYDKLDKAWKRAIIDYLGELQKVISKVDSIK